MEQLCGSKRNQGSLLGLLLLLVVYIPVLSGSHLKNKQLSLEVENEEREDASSMQKHWNFWKKNLALPYISNETQSLVLGTLGRTTYLNCIVGNIGDREVSWLRTRDLRILTIGKVRYTEDPRFQPLHTEGNDLWALKIRNASFEDQGIYECQVSYHGDTEKKLKWPVRLRILDSHAVIPGNEERHVKSGSRLLLRCFIEKSSGLPNFIYWYQNGDVMNYSDRPGVRIRTFSDIERPGFNSSEPTSSKSEPPAQSVVQRPNHPASVLTIERVTPEDAGNYTCSPSNAKNHTVQVHVVKVQLAMQRETGTKISSMKPVKSDRKKTAPVSRGSLRCPESIIIMALATLCQVFFR